MSVNDVARVYYKGVNSEGEVIVSLPGTNYQLHLKTDAPVEPSPQGRVRGVVRCSAWKLDRVSAGGSYIEPVFGRPRRVQGTVLGSIADSNSVVVDIAGQPIVATLPERWDATELTEGERVGLDIYDGAVFEPVDTARAAGLSRFDSVNLRPGY